MPLALVPPRRGYSGNYRIRGTVWGQYIDETTGTSDPVQAEAFHAQKQAQLYLDSLGAPPRITEVARTAAEAEMIGRWVRPGGVPQHWLELAALLPLIARKIAALPESEQEEARAWVRRVIANGSGR